MNLRYVFAQGTKCNLVDKIFRWQFLWISILFISHLVSQSYSVVTQQPSDSLGAWAILNLDNEANIPTWYSSCSLFLCAVILLGIAYSQWLSKSRLRWGWAGLVVLFTYLSADEASSLHEGFVPKLLYAITYKLSEGNHAVYFNWTQIGIPVVLIVLAGYFRFWLKLPSRTRWIFFTAAAIFLLGALGFEKISHIYETKYQTENTIAYVLTCGIEEFLEMLGVAIFTYGLLDYLATHIGFRTLGQQLQSHNELT